MGKFSWTDLQELARVNGAATSFELGAAAEKLAATARAEMASRGHMLNLAAIVRAGDLAQERASKLLAEAVEDVILRASPCMPCCGARFDSAPAAPTVVCPACASSWCLYCDRVFGSQAEALPHAEGCRAVSKMRSAAMAAQRATVRLLARELRDELAGIPSHIIEKALAGDRIALWGAVKTSTLRKELTPGAAGGGGAILHG